jgi:hypothetical protein
LSQPQLPLKHLEVSFYEENVTYILFNTFCGI